MIRKNIIKNKNDKQRYFLNDSWRIEMPAVVRTPFYGNNCSEFTVILRRTKVAYYAQVRSTTMKGIAHVLIYGL